MSIEGWHVGPCAASLRPPMIMILSQLIKLVGRFRATAAVLAALALSGVLTGIVPGMTDRAAIAEEAPIRIGLLATLDGAYEALGRDAMRGVELALDEFGGAVAGRSVELVIESTDGTSDGLARAVVKLMGEDQLEIIVGPLTGAEGVILRDIARGTPSITFVSGSAAAPDMTLHDAAPNLFRFSADVSQWLAGLGSYAYHKRSIRRVITVAEDYSFPYFQVFAFLAEFCDRGGRVAARHWLPIGGNRFAPLVQRIIPVDADAIFLALEGHDAVRFARAYHEAGGALPLIGGPVTVDEEFVQFANGAQDTMAGTLTSGPIASDDGDGAWRAFAERYGQAFPSGRKGPSIYAYAYYTNMRALLLALNDVDGELEPGHEDLREALADLRFDTPTGRVSLDDNRQGVVTNFVLELARRGDGGLRRVVVDKVKRVDQSLDLGRRAWLALGTPGRGTPVCR